MSHLRISRLAAVAVALVPAALFGAASEAHAGVDEQGRPWAKGSIVPELGIGFGYSEDLTSLRFGLGARYFVINGLSVGLSLSDTVLIFSGEYKSQFDDLTNNIPTNIFEITPKLQ